MAAPDDPPFWNHCIKGSFFLSSLPAREHDGGRGEGHFDWGRSDTGSATIILWKTTHHHRIRSIQTKHKVKMGWLFTCKTIIDITWKFSWILLFSSYYTVSVLFITVSLMFLCLCRDEIYCQICKQLVNNKNRRSRMLGWTLLSICLGIFPPTDFFMKVSLKQPFSNAAVFYLLSF